MTFTIDESETARADTNAPTTTYGSLQERVLSFSVIVVSGALSINSTSSAEPARLWEAPYVHESEATASGIGWEQRANVADHSEAARQAIYELRRISGLTWEQVGELFNVSRRSVHFWASGKPLNAGNEQRLMQVRDVVRAADRGNARATRAALFKVNKGTTAFALLAAGRFDEARTVLGAGATRPRPALMELSAAAKAARKPLKPDELIDAQHDRIHRDLGRARPARTVRNKRRGTS